MELIKTIRARVGTLRLAELRPLMRFPKKSLIRDSTVDFCVAKIAATANQIFAAQEAVRLSALAPNINRHPFGCRKDVNGEGGYGAFPNFPNAAGV